MLTVQHLHLPVRNHNNTLEIVSNLSYDSMIAYVNHEIHIQHILWSTEEKYFEHHDPRHGIKLMVYWKGVISASCTVLTWSICSRHLNALERQQILSLQNHSKFTGRLNKPVPVSLSHNNIPSIVALMLLRCPTVEIESHFPDASW